RAVNGSGGAGPSHTACTASTIGNRRARRASGRAFGPERTAPAAAPEACARWKRLFAGGAPRSTGKNGGIASGETGPEASLDRVPLESAAEAGSIVGSQAARRDPGFGKKGSGARAQRRRTSGGNGAARGRARG